MQLNHARRFSLDAVIYTSVFSFEGTCSGNSRGLFCSWRYQGFYSFLPCNFSSVFTELMPEFVNPTSPQLKTFVAAQPTGSTRQVESLYCVTEVSLKTTLGIALTVLLEARCQQQNQIFGVAVHMLQYGWMARIHKS